MVASAALAADEGNGPRPSGRGKVPKLEELLAASVAPAPTPAAPDKAMNLVYNGTFEQVDANSGVPVGWRGVPVFPGGKNVLVVDGGPKRGKVLLLHGDAGRMGAPGVMCMQTAEIPVKANTRYRCTGWTKSAGPTFIIFVKGFGLVKHNVGDRTSVYEEVYMMKKEISGPVTGRGVRDWEPFNLDFEVRPLRVFSDFNTKVEFVRVKIFAYWPPGTCWADDIRFFEVGPVPADQRVSEEAMTHAGIKPRLSAPDPNEGKFDEEQAYVDAGNAWKTGEYVKCHFLSSRLIAAAPGTGLYRLLLARSATMLGKWDDAEAQAQWVLEAQDKGAAGREVEGWMFDWAALVHAEVVLRTGDRAQGLALVEALVAKTDSPHVKAAARKVLAQAREGDKRPEAGSGGGSSANSAPSASMPATRPVPQPAPAPATGPAENFNDKAWHSLGRGGVWKIVADGEIHQLDGDKPWKNNGFNRKIEQSGPMAWEYEILVADGSCGAGMYVMADDEQANDRGTSYLLWYKHAKAEAGKPASGQMVVGKFVKNKRVKEFRVTFDVPVKFDEWARLRYEFDPASGRFTLYCQGQKVGDAVDAEPIKAGSHVSLHTCQTACKWRNLRVLK